MVYSIEQYCTLVKEESDVRYSKQDKDYLDMDLKKAIEKADFSNLNEVITIRLPEPFVIVLEEGTDIPDNDIYGKYTNIEKEVKVMVKSFYDPKIEEKGRKEGRKEEKEEKKKRKKQD